MMPLVIRFIGLMKSSWNSSPDALRSSPTSADRPPFVLFCGQRFSAGAREADMDKKQALFSFCFDFLRDFLEQPGKRMVNFILIT